MAQSTVATVQESFSNDNSISTKEFLDFEKTCGAYRDGDADEEIKMLFNEITKLSANNNKDPVIGADVEDVELILKRAEVIAQETENLLKSPEVAPYRDSKPIPQIKVTKPVENKVIAEKPSSQPKTNQTQKLKENEIRRKTKVRPFSAGIIDSKKREAPKTPKVLTYSSKKPTCKHERIEEELKDTYERLKSIEIINVQLTEDNKNLRKMLDELSEKKHIVDLKLVECENFLNRIGKQYEAQSADFKAAKDKENKLLAELNKEKNERKNLTVRHEKDTVVIHDLQRQVKEMEMILRRKHPDSVSALIVAAKSSTLEDNKKKLLEERITRLDQELKDKENHFQGILLTLQEKFGDMKQKYENHIIDVERQLMDERKISTELKNKITKANHVDSSVQTVPLSNNSKISKLTQTVMRPDRASSAVSRMTTNSTLLLHKLREDSYLVATIKGLQAELTVKQRTITKINRETEELKKNLRNLQKEKEVLMNLNPQRKPGCKQSKSAENLLARMNTEMEAELMEARKQKDAVVSERNGLLESLKRTNEDFIALKKKRIQDLHTLQLAHEQELMQMNMQLYPLQEEIKLLNRTVEILQERVRVADDKLLRYEAGQNDIHAGGDTGNKSKASSKKDLR